MPLPASPDAWVALGLAWGPAVIALIWVLRGEVVPRKVMDDAIKARDAAHAEVIQGWKDRLAASEADTVRFRDLAMKLAEQALELTKGPLEGGRSSRVPG
jgi:hypothetical protein